MSLWRSPKPVIAQVHGWCVGGGSDMALCADLVVASEDARIGTPYSRMWGCYLTGMWIYRLGLTQAKEYALTGQAAAGRRRSKSGSSTPRCRSRSSRGRCASRPSSWRAIPPSQMAAMKLVVNQAYENMGLDSTQTLGPILDGLMRNTPEAKHFIELADARGCARRSLERDAPFGDYSQAPPDTARPEQRHPALAGLLAP